jgi:hypothetical protein
VENIKQLSDDKLREVEQNLAAEKRQRETAKWDAELVGRYFRIIRSNEAGFMEWIGREPKFSEGDYVTLERTLAVGARDKHGYPRDYVYADVVYLHIIKRNEETLTCSGFEVSHENRKEPYLKIQPVFYSWSDFRNYLNSWPIGSGPVKHFDEITKEEYLAALDKAVRRFSELLKIGLDTLTV